MKRWLVVLIAVLFACGDKRSTTEPEVPTVASVTVAPDAHAVPDGSTVQITATLYDRNGQVFTSPPPGVSIAWSSADDAIASVSGNGLVTGNRPGETRITATAAGRSATATIEVTQVPTALVAVSGSGQEEAIGAELPEPLVVRVEDRHGDPVAGVAVTWSVSSGGGSLEPASGTTDDSGEASAVWTLGVESGEQSVRVTADEIADAYAEFVALSENQAPVATITTPTNGAIFSPGATIEFTGSAVDPEDGALTGDALIWSIGGKQLGKGESFSTDELEVGMHLVTLTATDSHGASGTAEVQIKVEAAALVCSNVVTLGEGATMAGELPSVVVTGKVTVTGETKVCGSLIIVGYGDLTIGANTVEVADSLSVGHKLNMQDAAGLVRVGGNATFHSSYTTGLLTAGTIEVGGDISMGGYYSPLDASGTHTVVLNGSGPQSVTNSHGASLVGDGSRFNNLRIENPNTITFGNIAVRGSLEVAAPATLTGEGTLIVVGELKSVAGSRIEVERVTMAGAMSISGAFSPDTIWFDGAGREIQGGLDYGSIVVRGSAVLGGDVEARGNVLVTGIDGLLDIGAQTLEVAGEFWTEQIGRLRMTDPAGVLSIGGDAWFGGGNSNELSAGTIEVLGNFTQRRGSSGCCTGFDESFRASGSHLVILKGTAPQVVDFNRGGLELTRSHFSGLQMTNPAGVTVEGTIAVRGQLDLSGQLTVPAEATLSIGSMLILGPTAVLHNQGTVTVPACTVEPGGTVTGVAQCGS